MSDGYVRLHRKLLHSDIMRYSANTFKLFCVLLLLAEWRAGSKRKRGVLATSLGRLADIMDISIPSVRRAIGNLVFLHILAYKAARQGAQRGTIITILKYDEYQTPPAHNPAHNQAHNPARQPAIVPGNNKDVRSNDVKKDKKKEERRDGDPSLSEFVAYWQERPEYEKDEARIAVGLKAYKLSFRVEEDLYNKIMGRGGYDGTLRSKSISQQVIERRRAQEVARGGGKIAVRTENAGQVFARIRDLPPLPPEARPLTGSGHGAHEPPAVDLEQTMGAEVPRAGENP